MPLRWPLRGRRATPVIDLVILSQAKAAAEEDAYADALLELRDWIARRARAEGTRIASAEYACTSLDPNARTGLRRLGHDVRRGAPPVHVSHTYLHGSASVDVLERIVRGTAATYAGPHGAVLSRYGRATTATYNLLAFDDDPTSDDGSRAAAYWILDKPPHDVIRYDAFDPLLGNLVELTRDRSGSVSGAAWRKKLGLGPTPEFWVEWRCTSPFTFGELDEGFAAWRAPPVVRGRAREGWRMLATRLG